MEKIVQTKQCKQCDTSFDITDKDLEFYEKVSPVFNGKKYLIPTPTLCSYCRQQRRLSWRNETKLYKRKCSLTNSDVVSIYSPDKDFVTYNQDDWWSDRYNPLDYGGDFDFTKTFFEQFLELQKKVPRITILNGFSDNADYGNHSYHNKNSYFVCSCGYVENCYYCVTMGNCNNCMDSDKLNDSENCYESIDSSKCYNCQYILNCLNCSDSYYCEDLEGSKSCIGCKGLKNKSYFLYNQEVTKNEFKNYLDKFKSGQISRKEIIQKYKKVKNETPSKNLKVINSENIYSSDKIENSKNVYNSFECINARDIKYCSEMMYQSVDNSYDYDLWGENSSYMYEVHCSGNAKNIIFSNVVWGGYNMIYCDNCLNNSKNCFGCIGLKNNEDYCILNKQYTKEEYNKLVPKIIEHMKKTGEWGEFFPSSLSPFGYNETVAEEYFPLTREEVLVSSPDKGRLGGVSETQPLPNPPLSGRGKNTFLHGPTFNWSDYEAPLPKVDKIIPANKLPENISDIPDDILNWAIECEVTKKPFRIIKEELEFYRKHNLPIPRRHPDQRHLDRMKLRNPRKLYKRGCDKCRKEIQTTYSPEREEIVYCETCYNSEIY